MVNRKAKGSRIEREYKSLLESIGYSVIKTTSNGRFGDKDFFNLFDLIGFRRTDIVMVQVKSNQIRGAVKQLAEFVNIPSNVKKFVVVRYDKSKPGYKKYGKWREIKVD